MKTAISGPSIVYGQRAATLLGTGANTNPDKGPSIVYEGWGLMDHRAGYNKSRPGAIGWYGSNSACVLDVAPLVLQAAAIAALQVPVAGTALTLTAGTGVTALAAATTVWGSGTSIPSGTLVINGLPTLVYAFNSVPNPYTNTTATMFYSPATTIARNVTIASVGIDTAATFTVRGYDVYGYSMSETITGAGAGATVAGKKAFKFVQSVTPAGTLSGSNVSVGYGDVIGFNLRVNSFGYTSVYYNNTLGTSTTTPFGTASAFVFADNTAPSPTTGDVRGTIYLGTANPANGTRVLQIFAAPSMLALAASGGLFGLTQA